MNRSSTTGFFSQRNCVNESLTRECSTALTAVALLYRGKRKTKVIVFPQTPFSRTLLRRSTILVFVIHVQYIYMGNFINMLYAAPAHNDQVAVVLPCSNFTTSTTLPSPHVLPGSWPFVVPPYVVKLVCPTSSSGRC